MNHLFHHLTAHPATTILTPNRRLSAALHKQYQDWQCEQQDAWTTPDILPLSAWFERLWQTLSSQRIADAPLILTTNQQRALWHEVLSQHKEHEHLLQITATADLAQKAWDLLHQWQIDLENPLFNYTEDYRAFRRWSVEFQQLCQQRNLLDKQRLITLLTDSITALELPSHIMLIGFTEVSPQHQTLLTACEQHGVIVSNEHLAQQQGDVQRIGLTDMQTEVATLARWAHNLNVQHPDARIGCVVPQLEQHREMICKVFGEVFHNAFNISAGQPLANYPAIHTGLQLLHLNKHSISFDTFSQLLRSPFIGEAEQEAAARARVDFKLRKDNVNEILLQQHEKYLITCPALVKRLNDFLKLKSASTNTFEQYAQHFIAILNTLGWPGERSLNSEEYQAVQKWLEIINELQTFDNILPPTSRKQALKHLSQLTQHTMFQPQSPDAPVQILGLLEAAGTQFDYAWVMGMDDIAWPSAPKPNPFIPKQLQKTLQMPHATAERELKFCRELTHQLQQSAKIIIFSHAEKDKDFHLNPSPLIAEFTPVTELSLTELTPPTLQVYQSQLSETLSDEQAPALSADEEIHGGAALLKAQAICPFKAFAEFRLHAREIESPTPGLRPTDRGTITHEAIELTWGQLQNQENLRNTPDEQLRQLLDTHIQTALTEYKPSRYITIESERLQKLLWNWLQQEKLRPEFTIFALEQKYQITLGTQSYNLRVDRIDQLADGSKFIIDYKTSKDLDSKKWLGDRPDEPQLPLYCFLDPENTSAIAFGQLHITNLKFIGMSQYQLDISGVKPLPSRDAWREQVQQWHEVLNKLNENFVLGAAQVDPKDGEKSCEYCQVKPLCRVNEIL